MKPIEVKFKDINNSLQSIEITFGLVLTDVSQMQYPPNPEPEYQSLNSLIDVTTNSSIFCLLDKFQPVREEISSNLSMPIEVGIKTEYLNKIFIFYSDLESRIIEDEQGNLSCNFVIFLDKPYNELIEFHKDIYNGFIESLRSNLRTEISYILNILKSMEKKHEISSTHKAANEKVDIKWMRDKGDLIELVKALCLIGAISNSTSNLTETEAYRIFGKLLGLELKRPSDIIKNKSKYQEKEYFLEELHAKFQGHLSTIREQ